MSRSTLVKVGLIGLLFAIVLVTRPLDRDWITVAILIFGIVNVLLDPPGTFVIRAMAINATYATLAYKDLRAFMLLLGWLVWPPAFMVSWALGRESRLARDVEQVESKAASLRARTTLAAIIAAVAIASIAYRIIAGGGLQQTAALFVGIPALLAIVVVFAVSPRSATGVACKAVTVGLLISVLFLGEGFLCVLMSAPIFYGVAVAIAVVIDRYRGPHQRSATTLMSCVLLLAWIPVDRNESVSVTKIVQVSPEAVERALLESPRFDRKLPRYLRAGFPRPIATRIDETPEKKVWLIRFRGGETRINGTEPREGDLVLEMEEARPGMIRWRAVSDSSHMTHFLWWRESVVTWEPVTANTTKVTWTLKYERGLDPAFYFGPWERYAADLAADYLIDSVATP
jgi:hypothetical protein